MQAQSIASALDKMCVQGLWPRDFPAMSAFSDKASLLSDLAGNAFTSTVCMAVALGTLVHAFPSAAKRGQKRKHVCFIDAEVETMPVIWRWEQATERPRTFRRLRKLKKDLTVIQAEIVEPAMNNWDAR